MDDKTLNNAGVQGLLVMRHQLMDELHRKANPSAGEKWGYIGRIAGQSAIVGGALNAALHGLGFNAHVSLMQKLKYEIPIWAAIGGAFAYFGFSRDQKIYKRYDTLNTIEKAVQDHIEGHVSAHGMPAVMTQAVQGDGRVEDETLGVRH